LAINAAYDMSDIELRENIVNDRWLSVTEISGYLGITKDSVYKWVNEFCKMRYSSERLI
jgi:predicted transcriptional regulator